MAAVIHKSWLMLKKLKDQDYLIRYLMNNFIEHDNFDVSLFCKVFCFRSVLLAWAWFHRRGLD